MTGPVQKVWSRCYGNERSEDINIAIFVQMKKKPTETKQEKQMGRQLRHGCWFERGIVFDNSIMSVIADIIRSHICLPVTEKRLSVLANSQITLLSSNTPKKWSFTASAPFIVTWKSPKKSFISTELLLNNTNRLQTICIPSAEKNINVQLFFIAVHWNISIF